MNWMIMPLRRYADFSGRSRRLEYWMFTLFMIIVGALWFVLFAVAGGLSDTDGGGGASLLLIILGSLFYLALIIPGLAVQARRFHDRDLTGWLVLLNLIPYLGGLIVFVFMLLPGTEGPNRYGPDPKNPHANADAMADIFR